MAASQVPLSDDSTGDPPAWSNPDALLKQIGDDLDQRIPLVIHDGGVVRPGSPPRLQPVSGNSDEGVKRHGVDLNVASGSARPRSGSSTWATGHRSSEGSRPSAAPASLLRDAGLSNTQAEDVRRAIRRYPQMELRVAAPDVWLSGRIAPLTDPIDAVFVLVAYPADMRRAVGGWAWWPNGLWVGPRHTNFGDGSICAFEPSDNVWTRADSLTTLLDHFSEWVVRQLYLLRFGRWPGLQVLHTAYERLTEHRPGELCGGCLSGLPYDSCCRPRDIRLPKHEVLQEFRARVPNPHRRPPASLQECQERFAQRRR